jgi:hypothetical protein
LPSKFHTDIIITGPPDILGDALLSAQLIIDGEVVDKTKVVENELMEPVWRLKGYMQL